MDVTTRTISKVEIGDFCGNATRIMKGRNTMGKNYAHDAQNTNTPIKRHKDIHLSICPSDFGFHNRIGVSFEISTRAAAREMAKYLNSIGVTITYHYEVDGHVHAWAISTRGDYPTTGASLSRMMGYDV